MYEGVDVSFYKKVYPKLGRYNNTIVLDHWNNNRVKKNLLGSKLQFSEKYPNFDLDTYMKYNKGLLSVGVKTSAALMCHYWHFGNSEGRICHEVKNNCTLKDIIDNYNITHCYLPVDDKQSIKQLYALYNLSLRIKSGLPVIAFNIDVDDVKYLENHDNNIYIVYTDYVELHKDLVSFMRTSNVMMVFYRDTKMKNQLDKLGILSILVKDEVFDKSDEHRDCVYLVKDQDNDVIMLLSVLPLTKILTDGKPQEIYTKCRVMVDKECSIDKKLKTFGIPVISEWTDQNDLLTKLINTYDETFDEHTSDRTLTNIKLNMEFFKNYRKILFVCNADDSENVEDTLRVMNYVKNIFSTDAHVQFYHSGTYTGQSSATVHITHINKLRNAMRCIKDHNFDAVVIKDYSLVNMQELFDCPIFYVMSNTDSEKQLSREMINCIKLASRVFSTRMNMVKYATRLNIPATVFYVNFINNNDNVIHNKQQNQLDNLRVPERKVPERKVPEQKVPEQKVPEQKVPESKVPESKSVLSKQESYVKQIPLIANECEYNYETLRNYLFTSRTVCILDEWDYNLGGSLDHMQKVIDYYKLLDINVIYVLYCDRTLFLHNSLSNIKFVDYSNESDLEFVYLKVIHHNIDTLIINSNTINYYKYTDKIKMSSRRIINMNTTDGTKILSDMSSKKLKVFINFAAQDIAYGGGNSFVQNILIHIDKLDNVECTFTLDNDINIYFLVDIRKDGRFKKFSFDEIYANKTKYGGRIIYRVNDCDVTRHKKSLEPMILKYVYNIDHFVFNSEFIKDYYFDNYDEFENKRFSIIYNTSNNNIFYAKNKKLGKKIRIATHHWSDNINKGYDYYYKLYKLEEKRDDIEMVFIGRKFNDNYKDPPKIHGPFKGVELANALRECDMYVTASIHDACPMHVLEGLCCGLPMLYIDYEGGGKNICEFSNNKVGESFKNFDELVEGIDKIKENYDMYRRNIAENMEMYGSDVCYERFIKVFIKENLKIE